MGLSVKQSADGTVTVECGGERATIARGPDGSIVVTMALAPTSEGRGAAGGATPGGPVRKRPPKVNPTHGGVIALRLGGAKPVALSAPKLTSIDAAERTIRELAASAGKKRTRSVELQWGGKRPLDISELVNRLGDLPVGKSPLSLKINRARRRK